MNTKWNIYKIKSKKKKLTRLNVRKINISSKLPKTN